MCWPTSKKSSNLTEAGRMPSRLFFQVGCGSSMAPDYTLFKIWSEIFMGREEKKYICETFLAVGGGLPIVQKQPPAQKKSARQQDKIAHNPLDSTSPLVKKGKQREVPKAKKPTPLKKVSAPAGQHLIYMYRLLSIYMFFFFFYPIFRSFWKKERRGNKDVCWRSEACCLNKSPGLLRKLQQKNSTTPQVGLVDLPAYSLSSLSDSCRLSYVSLFLTPQMKLEVHRRSCVSCWHWMLQIKWQKATMKSRKKIRQWSNKLLQHRLRLTQPADSKSTAESSESKTFLFSCTFNKLS